MRARLALARCGVDSWSGRIGTRTVKLLKTGMGSRAVAAALARLAPEGAAPGLVISAGFAGALQGALRAADLVAEELTPCAEASAALRRTADRLRLPLYFGRIAHSQRVLCDPQEKLALGRRTGALAVDLESATVRAWACRSGWPALALRVILDEAVCPLPRALPDGEDGPALARYAVGRPRDWPRLAAVWLRQRRAAGVLARFLKEFLEAI